MDKNTELGEQIVQGFCDGFKGFIEDIKPQKLTPLDAAYIICALDVGKKSV